MATLMTPVLFVIKYVRQQSIRLRVHLLSSYKTVSITEFRDYPRLVSHHLEASSI